MDEKGIDIEICIVIHHKFIQVFGRFNIIFRIPHYVTIASMQMGEVQGSC